MSVDVSGSRLQIRQAQGRGWGGGGVPFPSSLG